MRKRITRVIFKLHSYTGLVSGIALLLIGISGSILVFSPELEEIVYKNIHKCKVIGKAISLDTGIALARRSFPDMDYVGFDHLPQSPNDTYKFLMLKDGVQYTAFINPYTQEVIHSGERYDHIFDWLLIFHYTFAIPIWGDLAVALLSIALILSLVSGIVVYRKHILRVLLFRTKIDFANWRKASSGLHRVIGVWSLFFMLIISVTGLLMMKYAFTTTNFEREDWNVKAGYVTFSIDETLKKIKHEYPGYHAVEIFLPTRTDSLTYIAGYLDKPSFLFGDYNDQILFDGRAFKTNFISGKSNYEKFEGMIFPAHSGHYGKIGIKVIYCLGGLLPGMLSVTGALLWWRRKFYHKKPRTEV